MASTWEDLLQIELQTTGENSTTWGTKTNDNFERLADAIAGHESISIAGSGDYTISQATAVGATFRKAFLTLTGLLTGARVIIIPASSKTYYIRNATTGGYGITIKTAGGVAATIAESGITIVVCDGTDCYVGVNAVSRAGDTMTGKLTITSGGLAVDNTVSVSGAAIFGSTVSVSGAAAFGATVSVSGAAIFGSTVSVSGAAAFGSTVSVSGIATFKSAVSVSGIATFGRTVSVSGAATFKAAVSMASTLIVTNVATFESAVSVSGAATFKGAVSVSGAAILGKLDVLATASFGGQLIVNSTLNVAEATSVGGTLHVNGLLWTETSAQFGSNVSVSGTLYATSVQAGGLSLQPRATNSAIVGQFVRLNPGAGNALSLPAGGTWIYAITRFSAGAFVSEYADGPTAGGTVIGSATPGVVHVGWCWRVT